MMPPLTLPQRALRQRGLVFLLPCLLLSACNNPPPATPPAPAPLVSTPPPVAPPAPRPAPAPSVDVQRQMEIADLLYEARKALADNRLTTGRNNAYQLFFDVLRISPNNPQALEGMDDVARRYAALADNATAIGQYGEADTYLRRGRMINEDVEELRQAQQRLSEARQVRREQFPLDGDALRLQDIELMGYIGEVGALILRENATFLITARSDEEGRWIYKVMRDAVGGERLRGNIAIGSSPGIQVSFGRPAGQD